MQLDHTQHKNLKQTKNIVLICDGVTSPANAGGIFRLADAFGVKEIIFCGTSPDLKSNRLKKTARNTIENLRFRESEHSILELQKLHDQDYVSIALEITSQSKPLDLITFKNFKKIVLVIGNERSGIAEEVIEMCKKAAHITMYGENSSMNVTQATAIALYQISQF